MSTATLASASFADTKPHYELLDGLRGVAALLVLWYHVYEGFAFASGSPVIEPLNHGYLAVDFFFMLSGFVIGYAYDDRWNKSLTTGSFFRRRLIRLHPMVIMGAVVGAVFFLIQGGVMWDGTQVAGWRVMAALLCSLLFIPAMPGGTPEVRGNGEAFPLNGPAWSLFFEYIGNILYAIFIRRLGTKALAVLAVLLAVGLTLFTTNNVTGDGCLSVGWTMQGVGFLGGSLRMLCPFTIGILLSRVFRPGKIRGAFWLCSAILVAVFMVPFLGSDGPVSLNGVFEAACIVLLFPVVVWLGASGRTTDRFSSGVCKFLGDISFPLYIIHYPAMYLFYSWLIDNKLYTLSETWVVAVGVCLFNILLAYACLKLYDEPVRRWLSRKFKTSK